MRERPDRRSIRPEWIQHVMEHPVRQVVQEDGRIRRWAPIAEMDAVLTCDTTCRRGDCAQCFFRPVLYAMKIQYFQDTDTLHIEFRAEEVAETRDLDQDTLLDGDRDGNICGITIEHAKSRTDIPKFSYNYTAAKPI